MVLRMCFFNVCWTEMWKSGAERPVVRIFATDVLNLCVDVPESCSCILSLPFLALTWNPPEGPV